MQNFVYTWNASTYRDSTFPIVDEKHLFLPLREMYTLKY